MSDPSTCTLFVELIEFISSRILHIVIFSLSKSWPRVTDLLIQPPLFDCNDVLRLV